MKTKDIPIEYIPDINADIITVKIGKIDFYIWDYTGEEQFTFLIEEFIRGSDVILLVSDSTSENIEKSKFFLEMIKSKTPNARLAVIGNKQDLIKAMDVKEIEKILGIKTYSMIAIDPINRKKMIQFIA
ncbi:MAG: ADP-ribosylation factor-like protein, partial [Candidatus Hodarchaeota archaeon]